MAEKALRDLRASLRIADCGLRIHCESRIADSGFIVDCGLRQLAIRNPQSAIRNV